MRCGFCLIHISVLNDIVVHKNCFPCGAPPKGELHQHAMVGTALSRPIADSQSIHADLSGVPPQGVQPRDCDTMAGEVMS